MLTQRFNKTTTLTVQDATELFNKCVGYYVTLIALFLIKYLYVDKYLYFIKLPAYK